MLSKSRWPRATSTKGIIFSVTHKPPEANWKLSGGRLETCKESKTDFIGDSVCGGLSYEIISNLRNPAAKKSRTEVSDSVLVHPLHTYPRGSALGREGFLC